MQGAGAMHLTWGFDDAVGMSYRDVCHLAVTAPAMASW